jgi:hypothetical protein
MHNRYLLPCVALLGAATAPAAPPPAAIARPLLLDAAAAAAPAPDPSATRHRTAVLDRALVSGLGAGTRIEFNLFTDAAFSGIVERSFAKRTWSGRLEGRPGSFTVAANDGAVVAIVNAPGAGVFRVRSAGDAALIQEVAVADLAPCAEPLTPPAPAPGAGGAAAGGGAAGITGCADGSVITVMVLYTPLARDGAGGAAPIEAEIDLSVALANQAYTNSLIGMQLELVHVAEVNYGEPGNYQGHLTGLTNPNDSKMDEVHGLRYFHLADLVDLFVADGQYCGIAWLMNQNSPSFESMGFSVTTWYCAGAGMTFAHELGHNMGCCHAPGDGGGCFSGGLFDWSVGYRFTGNSGTLWRDIMAYSPGVRIPNMSNPLVFHDGQPTGVPPGPNGADNATTINLTSPTIANFRCALPFCDAQRLEAADGAFNDFFGQSLAADGTALASGAPLDADNGVNAGSAYVLRRDGNSWSQEDKLLASDGAAGDLLGYSVGISGDAVVAGASRDDDNGVDSGAAYVFRLQGGAWFEEEKLLAADGAAGDHFGWSVAISGDRALAGADLADGVGADSGSAYVFARSGGTWSQQAKLTASDGAALDRFGWAVALDGDVAIVGAPQETGGSATGSAYIFRKAPAGPGWNQEAILQASNGLGNNEFGTSVAIDGDVAIVGAAVDDGAGQWAGAAYVFRRIAGTWVEEAILVPDDIGEHDMFGSGVDVDGDLAMVGAFSDNDNGMMSGSAYVFERAAGAWTQTAKLLAPGGAAFDALGAEVEIQAGLAIAGAAGDDDGAIQVFRGFSGADCNGNAELDDCEVLAGKAPDLNGNGVPDECDIPADLDGDGSVGIVDFLLLLNNWGPCDDCGACLGDLDGDCTVGVADFLGLLEEWG